MVDFSAYIVGQRVRLVNDFGDGSTRRFTEFRIARTAVDESSVPDALSVIELLDAVDATVERALPNKPASAPVSTEAGASMSSIAAT